MIYPLMMIRDYIDLIVNSPIFESKIICPPENASLEEINEHNKRAMEEFNRLYKK